MDKAWMFLSVDVLREEISKSAATVEGYYSIHRAWTFHISQELGALSEREARGDFLEKELRSLWSEHLRVKLLCQMANRRREVKSRQVRKELQIRMTLRRARHSKLRG